jgi:hypothetical protein
MQFVEYFVYFAGRSHSFVCYFLTVRLEISLAAFSTALEASAKLSNFLLMVSANAN